MTRLGAAVRSDVLWATERTAAGLALRAALVTLVLASAAVVGYAAAVRPSMTLTFFVALAYVILAVMRPAEAVAVFMFSVFLAQLMPGSGAIGFGLAKAAGLVLMAAFLVRMAASRDLRASQRALLRRHRGLAIGLAALLLWIVASLLWAADADRATSALTRYALNIALFPVVLAAVRRREHAWWIVAAYILGASASAAFGLVMASPTGHVVGRLAGASGEPNSLSAFLISGGVLVVAVWHRWRFAIARFALVGAGVGCFVATMLTQSRGGLIAGAICLVVAVAMAPRRWRLPLLVASAVLASGVIAYLTTIAPPQVQDRFAVLASPSTALARSSGRDALWTVALRMVDSHPVSGVGVGNFTNRSVDFAIEPGDITDATYVVDRLLVAHNAYLQTTAELGFVGLVLYLFVLGYIVRFGWRAQSRAAADGDAGGALLVGGLLLALVTLLAANLFLSSIYNKQLWMLAAMVVAAGSLLEREAGARDDRRL